MRRRSVIAIAAFLAILASILPLVALSGMQQRHAAQVQRDYVANFASLTATRAERTLDNAKQALARAQMIGVTDCSPEHRTQMGQVVADAHSIEDLGYFRNGELVCTRLGMILPPEPAHGADIDLGEGYSLTYAERPILFQGKPRIEIRRGDYGVLIIPGRLTDLVGYANMTLGVATAHGHVLELSGPADQQDLKALLSGQRFGTGNRYVFASRPAAGLIAFAFVDREQAGTVAAVDWRYALPIGLGISLVLIGIIIWVSRLQLSPEKTLELALRKREFVVHYQPIIELATGRCIAAEALVRWRPKNGQMVPPDQFIPLAEASGLISPLTDLVVEIVMMEMGLLLHDNPDLHISINIPARDIESGRFLPGLVAAVARAGVNPSQVWLEVTERGFMNASVATNAIESARAIGYRIAIDDFGTGYSNLALLEGVPLDALKIDKSFVDAIGQNAAQSIVMPHIIGMAHELKLVMIAEGIETPEQETYLRNANVQFGQGWLYSKALPVEQFRSFYSYNRGRAVA